MTEALRAFPAGAPVIVPELAKNLDWPGADKIAEKLEAQMGGQVPPEMQKIIEEGKQTIAAQGEEIAKLKGDRAMDEATLQQKAREAEMQAMADMQIAQIQIASDERIAEMKIASEARIAAYKARLQADAAAARPQPQAA